MLKEDTIAIKERHLDIGPWMDGKLSTLSKNANMLVNWRSFRKTPSLPEAYLELSRTSTMKLFFVTAKSR